MHHLPTFLQVWNICIYEDAFLVGEELDALNGSLVTNMQIDDQPVWRFKHPTIGDAYATTLALSPDLLGIFLSGSSTDNLTAQVTCGNVGVEKAVVVPKSLFPMMITRLREFSASDKYKVQWLSSWGASQPGKGVTIKDLKKKFRVSQEQILGMVAHRHIALNKALLISDDDLLFPPHLEIENASIQFGSWFGCAPWNPAAGVPQDA